MEDILNYLKKYGKEIIVGIFICISMALSCYSIFYNSKKEDNTIVANEVDTTKDKESEVQEEATTFYVDVKGAVVTPGVYQVEDGAIIQDVINLAGGFKEDAYQDGINLSQRISDEMVIYVYTTKEVKQNSKLNVNGNNKITTNSGSSYDASYNIQDRVEKKESVITKDNNASGGSNTNDTGFEENKIININTASKSDLTTLSGIGDVKAQAIIDYRNKNGKFSKIEDLMNVSGIGESTYNQIKDNIKL